jgi:hypothetical protein
MQNIYTATIECTFNLEDDNEYYINSSSELADRIENHLSKVGLGWIYPDQVCTTYIEDSLTISHEDLDVLWDLAKKGKSKKEFLNFIKNYNK